MLRRRADPLAVLLLPGRLEDFAGREHAQDLLAAPGVVAIEPRGFPAGLDGLPARAATRVARGQARRLRRRLPGRTVAVILFDPLQWPLARELAGRGGAELWYARPQGHGGGPPGGVRAGRFDREAAAAASVVFALDDAPASVNAPLRRRLRALGVALEPRP